MLFQNVLHACAMNFNMHVPCNMSVNMQAMVKSWHAWYIHVTRTKILLWLLLFLLVTAIVPSLVHTAMKYLKHAGQLHTHNTIDSPSNLTHYIKFAIGKLL